jgi:eukaryotic-like serine/threonine-protein kinase
MSQRFIRCPHCGKPHESLQRICPTTGKLSPPSGPSFPLPVAPARPPPWPPPRRDIVGKTIAGKYLVRRVLGGGATSTVFEAEHVVIGRTVALKVLRPSLVTAHGAVRRFHREARAAGCIGHPNVCDIYDVDTLDDGTPYIVMEKLVGHTLARRIAVEGKLALHDVVDILLQVLSALVAAHERGIVHRDIKPDNVFLAKRAGSPLVAKVLDFGVSKAVGSFHDDAAHEVDLTRRGMVMGTPHYMSPEQARGDRDLDPRVDVYACGVVLYEALTGERPFVATSDATVLREVLAGRPRPAHELRRALPIGFDAVLEKAMARERDRRYRSAAELQSALQGLRDGLRRVPANGRPLPPIRPPQTYVLEGVEAPTHIWMGRLPAPDEEPRTVAYRPLPGPHPNGSQDGGRSREAGSSPA